VVPVGPAFEHVEKGISRHTPPAHVAHIRARICPGSYLDTSTPRIARVEDASQHYGPRRLRSFPLGGNITRATYVAVSNTVIGVAMLDVGAVGALADVFRTSPMIATLGVLSLLATVYIARLPDVSS